jgi:hypothetical protein
VTVFIYTTNYCVAVSSTDVTFLPEKYQDIIMSHADRTNTLCTAVARNVISGSYQSCCHATHSYIMKQILEERHSSGGTEDMVILPIVTKRWFIIIIKIFCFYKETKLRKQTIDPYLTPWQCYTSQPFTDLLYLLPLWRSVPHLIIYSQ